MIHYTHSLQRLWVVVEISIHVKAIVHGGRQKRREKRRFSVSAQLDRAKNSLGLCP